MLLRERLISDLHMGKMHPGDRLPSIRQVARENGMDHRAVARAYRALVEEGLVEIQGRSGVRVAQNALTELCGGSRPPAESRWLADVLAQSWMRSLSVGRLQRMLEALVDVSWLRCACVESNRDQMAEYCAEIGELSRMRMLPVYASAHGSDSAELARLRDELREVDLVVTTQYHAGAVRAAVAPGGPPVVVLRINPELADAVRRHLRRHPMTVIAATSEFGERLRLMYGDVIWSERQLRVVLATDADAVQALDPSEPVLLTCAARELLPGLAVPELVFPDSPTIAAESMRDLAEQIIRLSLAQTIPE